MVTFGYSGYRGYIGYEGLQRLPSLHWLWRLRRLPRFLKTTAVPLRRPLLISEYSIEPDLSCKTISNGK